MSALARFCKTKGMQVSGYDKTETHLTDELVKEGIGVHYEDNIELVPKDADLVVYTPAIPANHKELNFCKANGYEVVKRSDLLQVITRNSFTIAVAGTHGKTTTSTIIAHLLKATGYDCSAFLGGISVNYNSNFLLGKNNVVVVEADEYDRSFLKLNPDIEVITSCDADHLDIYGDAEKLKEAYIQFAAGVKQGGNLIVKLGLDIKPQNVNTKTYSSDNSSAQVHGSNLQLHKGLYTFDWQLEGETITGIQMPVPGRHNVENAVAAIAVARLLDIDENKIKHAIQSFKGVKRRFEIVVNTDNVTYVDDYAHHPQEIKSFLNGLKTFRAGKKITCVFQPHLYSRTRDFADGFAESLSIADEVILLPIYPAREKPIPGVESEMIASKIKEAETKVMSKKEVLEHLSKFEHEVICTVGAGDIDQLVEPIAEIVKKK